MRAWDDEELQSCGWIMAPRHERFVICCMNLRFLMLSCHVEIRNSDAMRLRYKSHPHQRLNRDELRSAERRNEFI